MTLSAIFFPLEVPVWICTVVSADYTQQDVFDYADATEEAWRNGKLSEDIVGEQSKLTKADLVIFQVVLIGDQPTIGPPT